MTVDHSPYLEPTEFLDWQQDSVRDFVSSAIRGACGDTEKAIAIVTAVRDSIWYDPYTVTDNPHAYRASTVATAERAYCVPKAVLLTAACRAAGIPARLGFADVRNHLQTKALRERMGGSDVFVYHGYSLMFVNGCVGKGHPGVQSRAVRTLRCLADRIRRP